MLSIRNLSAAIGTTHILNGVDLQINAGEVHAIMGPNGAGKSTLGQVLAGREGYTVTGEVTFDGQDLLALTPEARAAAGLFLAFQYPVEIPGVGNMYFLRTAMNNVRRARGLPEHGAVDFLGLAKEHMARLDMDPALLSRSVNAGFSGGEKKRNEILQMSMLEPRFAILDETDSGLDIDALRVVAQGVQALRGPDRAMLIITHYPRLLEYVVPDQVHVLSGGRIIRSGGSGLARELEADGYGPTFAGQSGGAPSASAPLDPVPTP
ncbi:MAG: Fe-S cluster assembly ATPase SufC [Acidimicrobiia bacterium]